MANKAKNKEKSQFKDPYDLREGGLYESAVADIFPEIVSHEWKGKRKLDHVDLASPDCNNKNKVSKISKFIITVLGYLRLALAEAVWIFMQVYWVLIFSKLMYKKINFCLAQILKIL